MNIIIIIIIIILHSTCFGTAADGTRFGGLVDDGTGLGSLVDGTSFGGDPSGDISLLNNNNNNENKINNFILFIWIGIFYWF